MSAPRILRNRQLKGGNSRDLYSSTSFVKSLDISHELRGHVGCVNALDWSPDGQYLASGSDDTHVLIWDSHWAYGKVKVIQTGHTRNIFSVKFMPDTGNHIVISAAGDETIRVFDVEYSNSATTVMEESCARNIYRAHQDRVKRIAVEDSHCFLSCSEDGDVRQFDLRENKTAGSGFRTPLISYAKYQIDLNTLSLNKCNPYLLALGGSHPCAFLHDRRMTGRDMRTEWGTIPISSAPTQCVRKFRSPKSQQRTSFRGEHITALHFGNTNPRELLCSWSCDDVYLFDIHGPPEGRASDTLHTDASARSLAVSSDSALKRRRSTSPEDALSSAKGLTCLPLLRAIRNYLLCPPFFRGDYQAASNNSHDAITSVLVDHPDPMSFDVQVVDHLVVCHHLLRALAREDPNPQDPLPGPTSVSWACEAVYIIAFAFHNRSLDPATQKRLPDLTGPQDGPVIDITSCTTTDRQLFASYSAMIKSFNTLISSSEMLERTFRSEESRKFWLEKVCRSLLKSCEGEVNEIVELPWGPEDGLAQFNGGEDFFGEVEGYYDRETGYLYEEEGDSDEEESGFAHDDDDDDDDADDDDDDYTESYFDSEDSETQREVEYSDNSRSAAESVCPGVPINLPIRSYNGHCNVETVKDVNFFGLDDEYVMSGSDDGILFIWDKATGRIVTMLEGDESVVNVMEGHPDTNTLAVAGIDETVKIFQPFESGADMEAEGRQSRRIDLSEEYQIRARNIMAKRGDVVGLSGGTRRARSLLATLAGGMDRDDSCRTQ